MQNSIIIVEKRLKINMLQVKSIKKLDIVVNIHVNTKVLHIVNLI